MPFIGISLNRKDFPGFFKAQRLDQHLRDNLRLEVTCGIPTHIVHDRQGVFDGPGGGCDTGKFEGKVPGVFTGVDIGIHAV